MSNTVPGNSEAGSTEKPLSRFNALRAGAAGAFERLAASAEVAAVQAARLRTARSAEPGARSTGWLAGAFVVGMMIGVVLDRT